MPVSTKFRHRRNSRIWKKITRQQKKFESRVVEGITIDSIRITSPLARELTLTIVLEVALRIRLKIKEVTEFEIEVVLSDDDPELNTAASASV